MRTAIGGGRTDETATELRRTQLFIVASLATWAVFLGLAALIGRGASFRWDLAVARSIQRVRLRGFPTLMHVISLPGFTPFSQAIVAATTLALWRSRFHVEAVFCALTWGAEIIGQIVKGRIRRQRPEATIVRVFRPLRDPSFPSGHTLHYVAFYGYLVYLIFVRVRAGWLRRPLMGLLLGLIGAVGPSRVYRGDHWPSDVVASYCAGLPYLVGLIELYRGARVLGGRSRPWSRWDPRHPGRWPGHH